MGFTATYTIGQEQVRLSTARPVQVQRLAVEREVFPHDHAFCEVALVTDGRVEHVTEGGASSAGAGFVVVVPPGGVHALRRPLACRVANLYYLADWVLGGAGSLWSEPRLVRVYYGSHLFAGNRFRQPMEWRVPPGDLPVLRRTIDDLADELARERPSLVYVRCALLKLQLDLLRHAGDAAGPEVSLVDRPEIARALVAIEEAISCGEPLVVADMAAQFGMSPDHFNRLFHQEVGSSVRDYHQRRRVQQACALLLDRRRALKEIANLLGFGDAAHFHRSFRRITGQTPGNYRKQFLRPQ